MHYSIRKDKSYFLTMTMVDWIDLFTKLNHKIPARRNLCASAMCAGGFRLTQYFKLDFSLNDFISLIQVM